MEKQETALVTGGAGFIGSHLCYLLLEAGYRVICVDNFSTGSKNNIVHLLHNSSFELLEQDVSKGLTYEKPLSYIFHLASPASVVDYQNLPEETALVNSVGTIHVLQLAKHHAARFLFASTSEIYGDPKEHPQKESYWGNVNPVGIRACYDESKRFGEMMTQLHFRKYGLDTRIIRIFNTYGPRMRPNDGRVISNFINQALKNEPVTLYGSGDQTRSFCYVSDLVSGILSVMFHGKKGEIYNLGNPEEYSMKELAEKIIEMTESGSSISLGKIPEDDPVRRRPDINKTQTDTGWSPKVSLNEGLTKTIAYYTSLLKKT